MGVSMQTVENILDDAFGQRQISTIFGQTNQYRVILEVDPAFASSADLLYTLRFPGGGTSSTTTTAGNTASSGSAAPKAAAVSSAA